MQPALPQLPPNFVARFEPLDYLGSGGNGVVYRARALENDRIVALKVIDESHLRSAAARRAFIREARAILRLRHPNVVKLIDFEVPSDGGACLVTEFLAGGSLASWRYTWPGWARLLDAVDGVLAGLAYAHARGIVHCDIKPENILLGVDEEASMARLADFGVARLSAQSQGMGTTLKQWRTEELTGTPTYMSPEQAEGNLGAFGPWTDLYALGVVLFEVLSGKPPFDAGSVTGILLKHLQEPPPLLHMRAGIPELEGFSTIVDRLLAKDPWDRPRFAARLRAELVEFYEKGVAADAAQPPRVAVSPQDALHLDEPIRRDTLPGAGRIQRFPSRPKVASAGMRTLRARELGLVGREDELRTLIDAASAALRDRKPYVVLLHGPAGIGKTRLAAALREHLEERGMMRTWFGSYRVEVGGEAAGLRGAVEAFYLCLGLSREQTEDALNVRLRKLKGRDPWEVRALLNWFRPSSDGDAASPPVSDASVVGLSLRAVMRASRMDPLCVWLDDAHNALEGQVLPLVERMLTRSEKSMTVARRKEDDPADGMPCLVVLSYRSLGEHSDPTGTLRERLEALARCERVTELPLGPLREHAVSRLLVDEVGLLSEQARRIASQTGGSPFFALQAARAALEIGDLRANADPTDNSAELAIISDEYELAEPSRPLVVSPLSSGRLLHECLDDTLERLPNPQGRYALGMLALLSPSLPMATLQAALDLAWPEYPWEDELFGMLIDAVAAGLLRWETQEHARAPHTFAADHDGYGPNRAGPQLLHVITLDHEPLIRALTKELDRLGVADEAHRAAADALRRIYPAHHGKAAAARARHLAQARCPDDAWALMSSAIEHMVDNARFGEAVALAQELTGWFDTWCEPADSERRGHVHRALARAAIACGAYHEARRHLEAEVARRTEDPLVIAERALLQAKVFMASGDFDDAERAFATARITYEQLGDGRHLGQALLGLAQALRLKGDLGRAAKTAKSALTVFATAQDHRGRAACLRSMGQVAVLAGDYEQARTYYDQSLALYTSLADLHGTADVQRGLGGLDLELGHHDRALVTLRDAQQAYETLGDLSGAAQSLRGLARARRAKGQPDVAVSMLRRAVELLDQIGGTIGVADCLLDLASGLRELSDLPAAIATLERAATVFEQTGDRRGMGSCLMTLGNVLLDAGQHADAIAQHDEAFRIFMEQGFAQGALIAQLNLGHAQLIAGEPVLARELLEAVENSARDMADKTIAATAAAYAAIAAASNSELERARACFVRATAESVEQVSSAELAASFERLSDVLAERDEGLRLAVEALVVAEQHFEHANKRRAMRRANRKRADLIARVGAPPQRR